MIELSFDQFRMTSWAESEALYNHARMYVVREYGEDFARRPWLPGSSTTTQRICESCKCQ
jgi:hypothetical protein